MSIDWWTIGLQAVNVGILVWLLSRVLWHPLARAINERQATLQTLITNVHSTQKDADTVLADNIKTREELADERESLLADAIERANAASNAFMADASEKAAALLKSTEQSRARESIAIRARNNADAALLAVDIARKLLLRLDSDKVHATFLDWLIETIKRMSADDKMELRDSPGGINLVSAQELDDKAKSHVNFLIGDALNGQPHLNFLTDHELIAGFEIRTPHFTLRDSWQSDLATILEDLQHAA